MPRNGLATTPSSSSRSTIVQSALPSSNHGAVHECGPARLRLSSSCRRREDGWCMTFSPWRLSTSKATNAIGIDRSLVRSTRSARATKSGLAVRERDQFAVEDAARGEGFKFGEERCHVPEPPAPGFERAFGADEAAEAVELRLVSVAVPGGHGGGPRQHRAGDGRRPQA
jgi:hypothetical protein